MMMILCYLGVHFQIGFMLSVKREKKVCNSVHVTVPLNQYLSFPINIPTLLVVAAKNAITVSLNFRIFTSKLS